METITITTGMNGYPQGLYQVLTASTMNELKEMQAKHGGELIWVSQKAGWSFWNNDGSFFDNSLLDMRASDSDTVIRYRAANDDIEEIAKEYVIGGESIGEALEALNPNASIDEAMKILASWKERMQDIMDAITEGEDCDLWLGNPDPTYIDFTITAETLSFRSDVTTRMIALQVENIAEIL